MPHARMSTIGLLAAALLTLGACSGGGGGPELSDPVLTIRDPNATTRLRMRATSETWDGVEAGTLDRRAARLALKSVAWAPANPGDLRIAAFEAILRDQTPEGQADNRAMAGLMLMRERELAVVSRISEAAAARGWTELTPHLVRSLARPIEDLTLDERPERDALLAIHPERSLAEIAFGVFLNPGVDPGPYDVRYDLRARADAWGLIARVDPDRSMRKALLLSAEADRAASDVEVLRKLRRGLLDLGATPSAADEMRWLLRLRDQADGMNTEWWTRAAAANDRLREDQSQRLELRHAEPIRWVAANRSAWLDTNRADLITELGDRLAERSVVERSVNDFGAGKQPPEDFESNIARLSWADLLTILVVDEALHTPRVVHAIFDAVELDRRDTTTEYGGIIEATELGAEPFQAVLYPPRARARAGDNRFVASQDMIEASDRALVHFHMQVQRPANRRFAGPSLGDFRYAALSGRTAVVFTSLDRDTLNVDVYQPNGVVVDLGEMTRPLD